MISRQMIATVAQTIEFLKPAPIGHAMRGGVHCGGGEWTQPALSGAMASRKMYGFLPCPSGR